MKSAVAISCALLFSAASVAHAESINRTVASGKQTRMTGYYTWTRDCVPTSGIVKVVRKPEHGTLSTRIVPVTIGRGQLYGREDCAGTPAKALQVDYKSKPGFRGTDTFELDITFGGTGRQTFHSYTVT